MGDGYVISTTNPGVGLVVTTLVVCIFFFVLGLLLVPGSPLAPLYSYLSSNFKGNRNQTEQGEQEEDGSTRKQETAQNNTTAGTSKQNLESGTRNSDNLYHLEEDHKEQDEAIIKTRNKKSRGKKRYGGIKSSASLRNLAKSTEVLYVNKTNTRRGSNERPKKNKKVKITVKKKTRIGRYEEQLQFEDFHLWNDNASMAEGTFSGISINGEDNSVDDKSTITEAQTVITASNKSLISDNDCSLDSNANFALLNREMKKMFDLVTPWIIQSLMTDVSEVIYMMIMSHYLGLGELICYSSVWFVLSSVQFLTHSWHSSVYKHLIAAVAKETDEGYFLAGRYLQIGSLGKLFLMLPVNTMATLWMPSIMSWIGYDEEIVDMSKGFAAVASISQISNNFSSLFSSLLEIEGYAKFNAIYDFWDSLVSILLCFIFIFLFRPSLLALGIFHCLLDVSSAIYYMYLTFEKREMFECYHEGIVAPIDFSVLNSLKSIFKTALPFVCLETAGYVQDILFALFASYQGTAEAATWIILDYIWGLVEIAPECIASAATVRVEHNLARGNLVTARQIANRTLIICTVSATVFSLLLLDTRPYLAWCLSLDPTLEMMIIEIIPFISLCQPFITVGVTSEYLNEVLGKYYTSVKTSTFIDMLFTIPVAAIFTFWFNYNVEGLASALCMGYAATGVTNIALYANTDWENASMKIQRYA